MPTRNKKLPLRCYCLYCYCLPVFPPHDCSGYSPRLFLSLLSPKTPAACVWSNNWLDWCLTSFRNHSNGLYSDNQLKAQFLNEDMIMLLHKIVRSLYGIHRWKGARRAPLKARRRTDYNYDNDWFSVLRHPVLVRRARAQQVGFRRWVGWQHGIERRIIPYANSKSLY